MVQPTQRAHAHVRSGWREEVRAQKCDTVVAKQALRHLEP